MKELDGWALAAMGSGSTQDTGTEIMAALNTTIAGTMIAAETRVGITTRAFPQMM